MACQNNLKVEVKIPFASNRIATLIYDVLRVDSEPKRSGVTKEIKVENCDLLVVFEGSLARQLRVAVNSFFENITLISDTISYLGAPISESYSYY